MKIKFIKDHTHYKAGDVVNVGEERAKYLILVKAAEEVKDEKPAEKKESKSAAKRQTKELKVSKKTK